MLKHETYIREVSGSDTAILFIHGFLGSTEHFREFIEIVPESVSVYNILLEGHGGTVKNFANASMDKWKKQILDITDNLCKKYENIYITAHSMGTFFAMDMSLKYPQKIKGIFLLQTPLKIGVKWGAVINTLKSFFDVFSDDEISQAYKNSHSVKLNFRLWEYIGWIPRYVELFSESKKARNSIGKVVVPTYIYQSAKDELVSMKSLKFIPKKENIKLTVLKKSAHFIYDKKEFEFILKRFGGFYGKRNI